MKTIQDHVDELNKIGLKSWLVVTCDVVPHNGSQRFRFMVDGFVSLDAEIAPHGKNMTILSTRLQDGNYPEDQAFSFRRFDCGRKVTWACFKKHLLAFVEMSNARVKFPNCDMVYRPIPDCINVIRTNFVLREETKNGEEWERV